MSVGSVDVEGVTEIAAAPCVSPRKIVPSSSPT
jgi:hypothetical protein